MESLLKFIGFAFYVFAAFSLLIMLIHAIEIKGKPGRLAKSNFLHALMWLGFAIAATFCGYSLWQLGNSARHRQIVSKAMKSGNLDWIASCINGSDARLQRQAIDEVYSAYYKDAGFGDLLDFVAKYHKIDYETVDNVEKAVDKHIRKLYHAAEIKNDSASWQSFTNTVPGHFFLNFADSATMALEKRKWVSDDASFSRVRLLNDSAYAREYLKLYAQGKHRAGAKKIILDAQFPGSKCGVMIDSDYDGETTVRLTNSSQFPLTFALHGTFYDGFVKIQAGSSQTITVPNGYYYVSAVPTTSSRKYRVHSFYNHYTFAGYQAIDVTSANFNR